MRIHEVFGRKSGLSGAVSVAGAVWELLAAFPQPGTWEHPSSLTTLLPHPPNTTRALPRGFPELLCFHLSFLGFFFFLGGGEATKKHSPVSSDGNFLPPPTVDSVPLVVHHSPFVANTGSPPGRSFPHPQGHPAHSSGPQGASRAPPAP